MDLDGCVAVQSLAKLYSFVAVKLLARTGLWFSHAELGLKPQFCTAVQILARTGHLCSVAELG